MVGRLVEWPAKESVVETGPEGPKQLALDILRSGGVPQSSSLSGPGPVSPLPPILPFVQIKLIFNRQTLLSYEFFSRGSEMEMFLIPHQNPKPLVTYIPEPLLYSIRFISSPFPSLHLPLSCSLSISLRPPLPPFFAHFLSYEQPPGSGQFSAVLEDY